MKITIESTVSVKQPVTIELPEYFKLFKDWYLKCLPSGKLFQVTPHSIQIVTGQAFDNLFKFVEPCTESDFTSAYAATLQTLQAEAGIEHYFLIDNTTNPES